MWLVKFSSVNSPPENVTQANLTSGLHKVVYGIIYQRPRYEEWITCLWLHLNTVRGAAAEWATDAGIRLSFSGTFGDWQWPSFTPPKAKAGKRVDETPCWGFDRPILSTVSRCHDEISSFIIWSITRAARWFPLFTSSQSKSRVYSN